MTSMTYGKMAKRKAMKKRLKRKSVRKLNIVCRLRRPRTPKDLRPRPAARVAVAEDDEQESKQASKRASEEDREGCVVRRRKS
jgi:hypothetical protein